MRSINRFAVLLALILPLAVPSRSNAGGESEDFLKAQADNSLTSWEEYLGKHPTGTDALQARQAFDAILLEQASRSKTEPAALEALHKKCKTADGADKIWALWDDSCFDAAKASESSDAIRKYLIHFPGGRHVSDAKATEEHIAWEHSHKLNTKEAYLDFLREHASGDLAKTARQRIDQIEYDEVRKTDTVGAYELFLKSHYGHDEANKRLRELRYQETVASGTLEDWLIFFDKYQLDSETFMQRCPDQGRHDNHSGLD